uniref:uncharacterized protein LOC100182044 isoform X2 n=1 Tax=Ciona intestinalis TaxID=7719 RepID=UPI00089DACB0|nr:uncharacterized protein LOC100182044 isoform X2 [Ciona intestinalis]|eukprot:XP_018667394.1 uncharacterized protein LOC100182044 isoform X2 [Ciona intestinalis]
MKQLLFFAYIWNIALSNQLMISKESQQFHSYSTKSSLKTKIGYKKCLFSVPSYVYATVKATESSLPHTFNVTVLDVKESYFEVELKRTDISEGWNMFVTVDWYFYIGNGVVYENKVIWIADLFSTKSMNYVTAKADCKEKGGKLVEIVDEPMYDVVYNYVRSKFSFGSLEYAYVQLASTYDPNTDEITKENGKPGYVKWLTTFPKKESKGTSLLLRIVPPTSMSINHGIWNHSPDSIKNLMIPVCETHI